MTLRDVKRFRIQASAICETVEAIRTAGQDGYEWFVIWSGQRDNDIFTVAKVHIPDQTSYKTYSGLCVRIDGPELHRLNVWLYEAQQVIGVQVHSHPALRLSLVNRRYLSDRHTGGKPFRCSSFLRARRLGIKWYCRLPPRGRRLAKTNQSP